MSLLWQRAAFDKEFMRIFCLVHAEKLSYQTADKALRSLTEVIQGRSGIDYNTISCRPFSDSCFYFHFIRLSFSDSM